MAYGEIRVDTITFTNGGSDQSVTVSGLVNSVSGDLTVTGTVSALNVIGTSIVSGATVTGSAGSFVFVTGGSAAFTSVTGTTVTGGTANFVSGRFTTLVSGATVRGTVVSGNTVTGGTGQFTTLTGGTAGFTTITGTSVTGANANFVSGRFTGVISGATVTGEAGLFDSVTGNTASFTTATGTTANFVSGIFTDLNVTTATITSGLFATGTSGNPSIAFVSDNDTGFYSPSGGTLGFVNNGIERIRITNVGTLVRGHTASVPVSRLDNGSSGFACGVQFVGGVLGNSANQSISAFGTSSAAFGAQLYLTKSNTTTIGDQALVANNDLIGCIQFQGSDGVQYQRVADLRAEVDGVAASGDVPGRFVIRTAPAGSTALTERLRITSAGNVGIGTNAPAGILNVSSVTAANSSLTYDTANIANFDYGIIQLALGIENTAPFGAYLQARDNTNAARALLLNPKGGNVGIGTTSPSSLLHLSADIAHQITLERTGATPSISKIKNSGNLLVFEQNTNGIAFETGSTPTERARIDNSGRLLVGTSSARGNFFNTTGQEVRFQIEGTTYLTSAESITINSNDNIGAQIILAKSRGTAIGSNTIAQNNDEIGRFNFMANDGSEFVEAAAIRGFVDGTPGANDMPGRLVFSTTADGASSPTERMRLTSAGNLLIGNTTGTNRLDVTGTALVSTSITTTNAYGDGALVGDTKVNGIVEAGALDLPGTTTNLHLYSQDFSTGWVSGTANATLSVDSAAVAPDGTTGVGKFVCADTTSASRRLYASANLVTLSGTEYTYSVYVKSVNNWPVVHISMSGSTALGGFGNAYFNLLTGEKLVSPSNAPVSIASVGDGWWRISVTTVGNTVTNMRPKLLLLSSINDASAATVPGIVDAGIYVWGAQLTPVPAGKASALGPYVRTDATDVTSAAGYIKINGTTRIDGVGNVTANAITVRTSPANSDVTATATAVSLLDGIRTGTPTAAVDLQLPTGANMDAAFTRLDINQSFEWSVINLAAATHVITVTANTDHTVVGNMAVAAATSGRFLTRKTAANTFITYRIS